MKKGFTLIEMMIVISIIALLMAIIIPDLMKTREVTKKQAASASMRAIQSALELYYTRNKTFPMQLDVLIMEGYLSEESNVDPWGTLYYYEAVRKGSEATGPGVEEERAHNYYLSSAGPDCIHGTEDDVPPPLNPKRHDPRLAKEAVAIEYE